MKDTDEIKQFVDLLPLDGLVEIQKSGYVYYGEGYVSTGANNFKTIIKISKHKTTDTMVNVWSKKASIKFEFMFKDTKQALEDFKTVFQKFIN